MADKQAEDGGKCVACDVIFYGAAAVAAVVAALIAFDYVTDGKVSEWLSAMFRKVPALASVTAIREEAAADGSDGAA